MMRRANFLVRNRKSFSSFIIQPSSFNSVARLFVPLAVGLIPSPHSTGSPRANRPPLEQTAPLVVAVIPRRNLLLPSLLRYPHLRPRRPRIQLPRRDRARRPLCVLVLQRSVDVLRFLGFAFRLIQL